MIITLECRNGNKQQFASEDEAMELLSAKDWTVCENGWEPAGNGRERLLIWQSEEESENDDGTNAIAQLIRPE